ncbi:MAG: GldG family protein [Acidobacteriota bacterium]
MAATSPKRVTNFAQAMAYTAIVIAILAAVNFLANRYNKSVDTTANKRYTLSDQTVKIAKDLKQDITISFWDRPDAFTTAKDLLDRYETLSPHVKVVYQDLEKNRTGAIAAGVTSRGAVIVEIGNKKEQAKSLTEEEITGAMVRALKGGDRVVCFTTGYGEGDPGDSQPEGYASVKQLAERNNYKTQTVALIPVPTIPKECTVLVVGGPKRDYLQPAVDAIRNYVEGGGHAMILLNPPLKFGSQVDDNTALDTVLASWGVKTNTDLVLDLSGVGQLFGMGPELPVVTKFEDHPIVRGLKNMATAFPLTRSLTKDTSDKASVSPLLTTSPDAVATTDMKSSAVKVDEKTKGAKTLAIAGEMNAAPKGRFVVVGTSRWVANGFLAFNGNRDLFMNMVNWLSSDEDLIAIRPKDPEDRRLNMNSRQVSLMFFGSVIGIPALMFLAGLSVWWRRR